MKKFSSVLAASVLAISMILPASVFAQDARASATASVNNVPILRLVYKTGRGPFLTGIFSNISVSAGTEDVKIYTKPGINLISSQDGNSSVNSLTSADLQLVGGNASTT
jgi:hypothetical protein